MIVEFKNNSDMNVFIAALCREAASFYMMPEHNRIFVCKPETFKDLSEESKKILEGLPYQIIDNPSDPAEEDTQEIRIIPLHPPAPAIKEDVKTAFEKSILGRLKRGAKNKG